MDKRWIEIYSGMFIMGRYEVNIKIDKWIH